MSVSDSLLALLLSALLLGAAPARASVTATASASTAELAPAGDTETAADLAQAGPVTLTDDAGSAAFGEALGDAVDARAQFAAHGCAAPNPIKTTGSANGLARVDVLESFTITSGSHPVGTPVDLSLRFSAVTRFNPKFQNGDSIGDAVGGSFEAAFGAYDLGSFSGTVSHTGNVIDGVATIVQGPWNGEQVTETYTTNGFFRVGDAMTLWMNGLAQAGASADWFPMMASVADADVEASVTWGASVAITGGGAGSVDLVSQQTGMPAPPLGNGNVDVAEQNLPPRPPTVFMPKLPTLHPFGVGVLAAAMSILGARATRRRRGPRQRP